MNTVQTKEPPDYSWFELEEKERRKRKGNYGTGGRVNNARDRVDLFKREEKKM